MEKFALTLQSQPDIDDYIAGRAMAYERELLGELSAAIASGDLEKLNWFAGFGDSLRQILMNVNEHRKALEFGFTEIAFNQYGWFAAPKFLEFEEIEMEKSSIRIGRGPNGTWAYALSRSYGVAGASGPLCVFCKKYPNREVCLNTALAELKADMLKYIGNSDTTNYKQDVLQKTLKAIAAFQVSRVQLALF
ncbi:MAG: hypothetical protein AAGC65_25980 [Mucilaginibacter sp.]|uniref:hypothetical protein n=1 Tax=Mucilaginibacter sp. TaxID=1882438 RepID=UPI0031AF428F